MHQKTLNFDEITNLMNLPLKSGDSWYLLDKKWFDMCKAYHEKNDSASHPGPIDNSALFQQVVNNNNNNNVNNSTSNNINSNTPLTKSSNGTSNSSPTNEADTFKLPTASAVSICSRPLRADLSEAEGHFVLVPETCWNILKEKFGLINANHSIKRSVIEVAPNQTMVEIWPVKIKLCLYGGTEPTIERNFSRGTTLGELQREMRKAFDVKEDKEVKLWVGSTVYTFKRKPEAAASGNENVCPPTPPPKPSSPVTSNSSPTTPTVITRQAANSLNKSSDQKSSSQSEEENASDLILNNIGISGSVVATLEVINQDGTWPSSRPRYGTVSTRSSKAQPGLCGLSNMGNTCFMNSAIQCLSNTPTLTDYILSDKYVNDINPSNPLGMHGEIARTYADLIKVLWSGNNTSFLPREFKCAVSRFAPQFNGFAQQDCQELMAFLLDGLHEDLNRIRVKPYIEIKNDFETRPDEVVAAESWANYKKRNDSIVVDTFHAMLKSTLVCPGCKLVSVTFDPFCYLSLPLPVKREKQVNMIFIPAPSKMSKATFNSLSEILKPNELETIKQYGSSISSFGSHVEEMGCYEDPARRPKSCKMHVPRSGPASEICEIVARIMNEENSGRDIKPVDPGMLVVAELSLDGKISKVYESNEHYKQIGDDVVVVEKGSKYLLPMYIRERKNYTTMNGNAIAKPMFLHVENLKYETLYKSCIASLSNLSSLLERDTEQMKMEVDQKVSGEIISKQKNVPDDWYDIDVSSQTQTNAKQTHNEDSMEVVMQSGNDDSQNEPTRSNNPSWEPDDMVNDENTMDITSSGAAVKSAEQSKVNGRLVERSPEMEQPFVLCIVTSFGNHSVDTLSPQSNESDYNSKLYLGVTFTSLTVLTSQFRHLPRSSHCADDSIDSFTPKISPKPVLQLKDCITQFTNVERLGSDDPWYCPKCKKHQQATKKFDIWSLPQVLIIHLKRFSFSRSWRDKIDTLVEFPVEDLDMSKYVLNPEQKKSKQIYSLIGVANHFGGLGGGHYTAYAKNNVQNAWYTFDDSMVNAMSENSVVTRSAYVLFYQLKDC